MSTHQTVTAFVARNSSPAPRRSEVVAGVVSQYGPGTRKDYAAADRAVTRAVEAGVVVVNNDRCYVAR